MSISASDSAASSRSSAAGFTLVELMVAMAIFLIVSLGALPLMITNMHVNRRNQLRNEGIAIASRWVDWLHSKDWRPTGSSDLLVPDVAQTADTIDPRFNYAIDCSEAVTNRRFDCRVDVSWAYHGSDYHYATSTVVIE